MMINNMIQFQKKKLVQEGIHIKNCAQQFKWMTIAKKKKLVQEGIHIKNCAQQFKWMTIANL